MCDLWLKVKLFVLFCQLSMLNSVGSGFVRDDVLESQFCLGTMTKGLVEDLSHTGPLKPPVTSHFGDSVQSCQACVHLVLWGGAEVSKHNSHVTALRDKATNDCHVCQVCARVVRFSCSTCHCRQNWHYRLSRTSCCQTRCAAYRLMAPRSKSKSVLVTESGMLLNHIIYHRRKFRSQTVKLPTIWTDGKAEERVRRKKMQVRENVAKSRNTAFFQWFVAPEGRKVGSLKRRVGSHLGRWEMNNCTPLRREAHFEVKSVKNWRSQTIFGSWDYGKVHAVVARRKFLSQIVQSTPFSEHFWKLRCWKSGRRGGAKHIFQVKKHKAHHCRSTFEVEMSKRCLLSWCEAQFEVKSAKNWRARSTFGRSDVVSHGKCKGLRTLSKVSKAWGFCSISKNDGSRGAFEEDP